MRKLIAIVLTITLATIQTFAQLCSVPGDDAQWSPNFGYPGLQQGQVNDMIEGDDGLLYVCGYGAQNFGGDTRVKFVGAWDGTRWHIVPGIGCSQCGFGTSHVTAITKGKNGDLYFAGIFQAAENPNGSVVYSKNIIRYNVFTKTYSAVGTGMGGSGSLSFEDLEWRRDTLFVGGKFTEGYTATDTVQLTNVALFDEVSNTWNNLNGGVYSSVGYQNGTVHDIEIGPNNSVFIGGQFDVSGDLHSLSGIGKWSANSGWDSLAGGVHQTTSYSISPGSVQSMQYDHANNKLYVGGVFGDFIASAGVYQQRGLAVFDGLSWTRIRSVGVPASTTAFSVRGMHLDTANGELYIAGDFRKYSNYGGVNPSPGNGIAKLNLSTLLFDELEDGVTQGRMVHCVVPYNGHLYLGGTFISVNDTVSAFGFASWDGSHLHSYGNGISGGSNTIYAMEKYGSGTIVAGYFTNAGPLQNLNSVAFWNGNEWEDLGIRFNTPYAKLVKALKLQGNELWVGGRIDGIIDDNSDGIGRFNLNTRTWTVFGTGISGNNRRINAIEVFQGEVYVAGSFTSIDGTPANNMAKFNGSTWVAIGNFTHYSDEIMALENQGDSLLFIGGEIYSHNGDASQSDLVVYDGSQFSSIWPTFNGYRVVRALAQDSARGVMYVVGNGLETVNSSSSVYNNNVAAVVAISSQKVITGYDLGMTAQERYNTYTFAVDVDTSGNIIIGGRIPTANGVEVYHVARVSPTGTAGFFGSGVDVQLNYDQVYAISAADNGYYFGGTFTTAGSMPSHKIGFYGRDSFIPNLPNADITMDTITSTGQYVIRPDQFNSSNSYYWTNGDSTASATIFSSGMYTLLVTTPNGCNAEDSIYVQILPTPFMVGGNDDGYSNANSAVNDLSFYTGTNSDGHALEQVLVVEPSFFAGQQSDGFTQANLKLTPPAFFKGGVGDGFNKSESKFIDINLSNFSLSGSSGANPQVVTAEFTNLSFDPVYNFDLSLFENGQYMWTETINDTLYPGQPKSVTLQNTYSPTVSGPLNICGVVEHPDDANAANDTSCVSFTSTISIDEEENDAVVIYPNPADASVSVYLGSTGDFHSLVLMDSRGKILQERSVNHEEEVQFNTIHLPAGIYMIRLVGQTSQRVSRVMIVH